MVTHVAGITGKYHHGRFIEMVVSLDVLPGLSMNHDPSDLHL
jgi:hypothetical protein